MEPIPLPSPIHYELLLQLLERKTMSAVSDNPEVREKIRQLIVTLRKAAAQQKQLEETCSQAKLPTEYLWSLNHISPQSSKEPNSVTKTIGPPV